MFKRIILLTVIILLSLGSVSALNMSCGYAVLDENLNPTGEYLFPNNNTKRVLISIDNRFSIIQVTPNNFILEPGESQIVLFDSEPPSYAYLLVMYQEYPNGSSVGFECPFAAGYRYVTYIPETTTKFITTTTVQPYECYSLNYFSCIMQKSSCYWKGSTFLFGQCLPLSTTTTTIQEPTTTVAEPTTTLTSTTRIATTTTTVSQSICSGTNIWSCDQTKCKWVGDFRFGYCTEKTQTSTTMFTTTTTRTSTTITTTQGSTTTTICSSVCKKWLRYPICLSWEVVCNF